MTQTRPILALHLRYHLWATSQIFQGILPVPPNELTIDRGGSFGSIFSTLEHMFKADSLWLMRMKGIGNVKLSQVSASDDVHVLEREWTKVLKEFIDTFAALDEADISGTREFVNSEGISFSMPVWQILLHVVNHGTGHRGQVNCLLRQAGIKPPNSDLVQFYRQQARS